MLLPRSIPPIHFVMDTELTRLPSALTKPASYLRHRHTLRRPDQTTFILDGSVLSFADELLCARWNSSLAGHETRKIELTASLSTTQSKCITRLRTFQVAAADSDRLMKLRLISNAYLP